MLLTKKHIFILPLTFFLVLLTTQLSQADSTSDRASLTQASLELQRDLLLVQEKLRSEERIGLSFYLDTNNLLSSEPDSISISLAGKRILTNNFDAEQLKILANGGMQKLGAIPLAAGQHEFEVQIRANNRNITKTIKLEKSAGRDNLKITITNFMQQRNPDIIFEHETWAALQ